MLLSPRLGVLRHRNFTLYLSARILGALAVQMQSVAVGWQIYQITGSLLDLGLVGLAQFLPFVALILPAGQAADRLDRGRIITVCLAINLLCALLLLGFTFAGLTVVWPVFAVLMLFGAARAFGMPASQAILINLVPLGSFPQAVALSSSAFHVAVIAGPVLGGLLYLAGGGVRRSRRAAGLQRVADAGDARHARGGEPGAGLAAQCAGRPALCVLAPDHVGCHLAGHVRRAVWRCHGAAARCRPRRAAGGRH
ncbi:MFS transporter, partial [Roseateles sp. GG27B]